VKTTKSRYLTLLEVADLLKLEGSDHARRQYVRRVFRRLEQRDGTKYLHKTTTKYWSVCVDDLSRLDPHNWSCPGRTGPGCHDAS